MSLHTSATPWDGNCSTETLKCMTCVCMFLKVSFQFRKPVRLVSAQNSSDDQLIKTAAAPYFQYVCFSTIVLQNVHALFPGLQAYSLLTTLMRTISLSRDRGTQTDPSLPSEWHGIMLRGTQTLLASLKGSFFNHKSTFLDICAESGRFQSFGARLEIARAHDMLQFPWLMC